MSKFNKQHLSNIWDSVHERGDLKKCVACKKSAFWSRKKQMMQWKWRKTGYIHPWKKKDHLDNDT